MTDDSIFKPKYSLETPLTRIHGPDQLPAGSVELGQVKTSPLPGKPVYRLIKHEDHLTIHHYYYFRPVNKYVSDQYDFPLEALSWFPWALEEFRKPPAESGLHAGAMTTKDMDVGGEMLCVQSEIDGYALLNRSRNEQDGSLEYFDTMEISLSYDLLYDHGLLALWKSLGKKFDRGEI